MAQIKFWEGMTQAASVQPIDKLMVGVNADGSTQYANIQQLLALMQATGATGIKGDATSSTDPGSPSAPELYYAKLDNDASSTTFTNFLDSNSDPIVIPTREGTAPNEQIVVNPILIFDGTSWDAIWQLSDPINLSGYATTADVDAVNTRVDGSATKQELDVLSQEVGEFDRLPYTGAMTYRIFTSQSNSVTSSSSFSQANGADSDTIGYSGASASYVTYVETGENVDLDRKLVYIGTLGAFVTSAFAVGIGIEVSGVYQSLQYRSNGDLIVCTPYTVSVLLSGLPTLIEGDTVTLEIEPINGVQTVKAYKNGSLAGAADMPFDIDGNICLCMRGGGSVEVAKVTLVIEKLAKKYVEGEVDALTAAVNTKYPFQRNATFIRDGSSPGTDVSFVKDAIIDIKLFGMPLEWRVSAYVIRRDDSGLWQIDFWRDTGTGNGSDKENVLRWQQNGYVEPSGIDTIEYTNAVTGRGMKVYIDWSKVPTGANGSITYNAAGFDRSVFINFKSGAVPPSQEADRVVSWHYSDTDAPVTGTDLYKMFTVLPDQDGDGATVGCTGASYNTKTDEYVISYYSYAKASELWLYKRADLVDYNDTTPIVPVPTRKIDVSPYLYHIQGNVYDPEMDSYWVLGSINAASADTERVLIRVDDNGNLLERYELTDYSFQAGMLALSPDLQKILIKPNNKTWLLELDKYSKVETRQTTTGTTNEGLGVDYLKGYVYVAGGPGANGTIYKYRYSDMTLIGTYSFQTLTDDAGYQNVEGIIIDPIDGSLIIVADAFLHGGHLNGNAMWVFDFEKTIGKQVRFPDMMQWQGVESMVVDFGAVNNLAAATIEKGEGTIQYRGSNTAPSIGAITRINWRDRPYYGSWGSTTPSAWSGSFTAYRYMQLRIV